MRNHSQIPVPKLPSAYDDEEERTLLRPRVRQVHPAEREHTPRITRSVENIDARRSALARGATVPDVVDDHVPPTIPPPPSLPSEIPLTDEDLIEIDDDWLMNGKEPEPFPST